MEADWEFEIAPDAPVIEAAWSGFVNLQVEPEKAGSLPETARLPSLAQALVRLNNPASPVWTAKCDVWTPDEFDADELDAPQDSSHLALACYIDLLPRDEQMWSTIDALADWCRQFCMRLRAVPLRQCRAELIVRRAFLTTKQTGLATTAYLMACGADATAAKQALSTALCAFVDAVGAEPSQINRDHR